jgi:hypothetical protein
MTRNRPPHVPDERLDQLGRALVRAAAEAGRDAAAAAGSSPFLYARVRARVAERRGQSETEGGWLALLAVARRAVPTMAFAAAAASAVLLWFAWFGASTAGQFGNDGVVFVSDEVIFGGRGGVESAVLNAGDGPSQDEILRMIVERNGREAQGR